MLGQNSPTPPKSGGILSYPKTTRMEQIEQVIAVHQTMSRKPMSMRQIARRLNMSASGHLMAILWEMVEAKRLTATAREYRELGAWDFRVPKERMGAILETVYGKD